jgi:OmpA-OmpF porin, OOP family
MRHSQSLIAAAAFLVAGALAVGGAMWAATVIENRATAAIRHLLVNADFGWATVAADGLQVTLTGVAPTEAKRFRALSLAGTVVDAARVIDDMTVTPARAIEPPRFSVEMLRNDDGVSLIGLIPTATERYELVDAVTRLAQGLAVTDMLETSDYAPPQGWAEALNFGLMALKVLPRSKISIAHDRVAITAIADSVGEKRKLEASLAHQIPDGVQVAMAISAPRPVLTPFTLRFLIDDRGARFDACSADTEKARDRIIAAAVAAGVKGKANCTIGLGVPSPSWADAAVAGINAVAELGAGTVTFSDADVSLLATTDTPQATFDHAVGELEAQLPPVFSLQATLPEKPKTAPAEGPPEFTAVLSPEGAVQLRGRLADERERDAVTSYAQARFGVENVYTAARLDPGLPEGWPVRVLAGLEALANLHHGALAVRADTVEISGTTGSPDARENIARILSGKLGQGNAFTVDVTYEERLDPVAALPTPEECVHDLNAILEEHKIAFAPGNSTMAAGASTTIDALAAVVKQCKGARMEIGGHTDSQGSEGGNQLLSQARAEAVLLAIQGRRVSVGTITAKGYGESAPIADNDTEEGREANRRIEFKLITPEDEAAAQDAIETTEDPAATDAAVEVLPEDLMADDGSGDSVDEGSGDGDPSATEEGAGDGMIEAEAPAAGDDSGGAEPDTAPQETTEDAEALDSAADVTEPDENWVSSAPQEKTIQPKRRPADK